MKPGLSLFETPIGTCGLAWSERGIDGFHLPEKDAEATRQCLTERFCSRAVAGRPPAEWREITKRIRRHLRGKPDDFLDVPLDLSAASPFAGRLYRQLRMIAPGQWTTYGNLGKALKMRGGARAIGRAVGANPIGLLVPCHRVIGANGRLGGFSAHEGPALKARLLYLEGVVLRPEHEEGLKVLSRRDRVMKRIIAEHAPFLPGLNPPADPYEILTRSIIHQQLSVKAGQTIASRVVKLSPGPHMPTAQEMCSVADEDLRAAGLSRQKVSFVKDLARQVADGSLPLSRLARRPDEEVITRLTMVRGIGRWSAEMYLLFHLGRLDVLPVDDLGLRKAVQYAYGLDELPTAKELLERGETWRPYRSMATWFLWRNLG